MNLVQHVSSQETDERGALDCAPTSVGNMVVVLVGGDVPPVGFGTLTDDMGNTYVLRNQTPVTWGFAAVYIGTHLTGGVQHLTYTRTVDAPNDTYRDTSMCLLEFQGGAISPASIPAGSGGSDPPDTPYNTNSTTPPPFADGMVVAVAAAQSNTAVPVPDPSDYTLVEHIESSGPSSAFMVATRPLKDFLPQSCSFTGVDASPYAAIIVALPAEPEIGTVVVGDKAVGGLVVGDKRVGGLTAGDTVVGGVTVGDN